MSETTQQPAGIKCSNCGTLNRMGVLLCETCGASLVAEIRATGTKQFQAVSTDTQITATPAGISPSEAEQKLSQAVMSAGSDYFEESMVLRLEVDGSPAPLLIAPKGEITLGRRDPATGSMPDVDLTMYAGYRLGVSRSHAILRLRDQHLELIDLGSSNGTQLNGVKLSPHQPQIVRDGDHIILGKMQMRALFKSGGASTSPKPPTS